MFRSFAVLFALFASCGCMQHVNVDPARPVPGNWTDIGALTHSSVAVPTAVAVPRLQQIVNASLPTHFKEHLDTEVTNLLKHDYIEYDVTRTPINMGTSANRLTFATDINGLVAVGGQFGPGGGLGCRGEIKHLKATVRGNTGVSLSPDWTATADPHSDLDPGEAKLDLIVSGHVVATISVRQKLKDIYREKAPPLVHQAFNDALSNLQLRAKVNDIWNSMHLVKSVSDKPKTWLTVDPQAVHMTSINFPDGKMSTTIGLIANTQIYVEESKPEVKIKPLPQLVLDQNLGDQFDLQVPAYISITDMQDVVSAKLKDANFTPTPDITFHVYSAALATSGDLLVLDVDFKAINKSAKQIAKGHLYATGHLKFDATTQQVSIADLNYDVQTRNFLTNALADWVLKAKVLEAARVSAHFDLGRQLQSVKDQANAALTTWSTADSHFKPSVILRDLKLIDARIAASQAFVIAEACGSASLELNP